MPSNTSPSVLRRYLARIRHDKEVAGLAVRSDVRAGNFVAGVNQTHTTKPTSSTTVGTGASLFSSPQ